jgi:hypothetical protein
MKRFLIVGIIVFILSADLFAQGEINQQEKIFYRNEKSLSLSLTSTGWGINGRYAKRINAANKIIYDIDFAILKHPQEFRMPPNTYSYGTYVFGKMNIVMNFRFGYGKQKEMFRKFDVGGISIRHFYSFGGSLALLKPVYYEAYMPDQTYQTVRFNEQNSNSIFDRASFFKGFGEIKPIPGAFVKLGLCFEFSPTDNSIHAIEGGVIFDAYPKKLEMMYTKNNYWFFTSLFVSYRFGKVFDPSEKKEKKKKKKKKEDYYY